MAMRALPCGPVWASTASSTRAIVSSTGGTGSAPVISSITRMTSPTVSSAIAAAIAALLGKWR